MLRIVTSQNNAHLKNIFKFKTRKRKESKRKQRLSCFSLANDNRESIRQVFAKENTREKLKIDVKS